MGVEALRLGRGAAQAHPAGDAGGASGVARQHAAAGALVRGDELVRGAARATEECERRLRELPLDMLATGELIASRSDMPRVVVCGFFFFVFFFFGSSGGEPDSLAGCDA